MNDLVNYISLSLNKSVWSTVLGSSSTAKVDSAVTDMLTSDSASTEYSNVIQDYADVTQEALDAYQKEIDEGTVKNPQNSSTNFLYNSLINGKSSSSGASSILDTTGIINSYLAKTAYTS